ncbi:hypothetical protein N7457_001679 [Penicillium paradoxum]|uniref:uncharacterized protein n=1 Tax=Penicillium paradoxum TaxID=176176 RepID=UPI002547546F|nr:uncharacterized protein N7457_001679 [Penicillium paradoxum]KAJ5795080.1 hypothetical protein N7457_001679 [Penicillium paradoxum]
MTYDLPDPESVTLHKITPQLSRREDFDDWEGVVIKQLQGLKLQNLIDDQIERPKRCDPAAKRWWDLSLRVSSWLSDRLAPPLKNEIVLRGSKVNLADDFMRKCRRQLKAEGHGAMVKATTKFWKTKRTDFDTITEFVTEVKSRYKTTMDLNCGLRPYHALVLLVDQLGTVPALSNFVGRRNDRLALEGVKELSTRFTLEDLLEYSQDAIDEINLKGLDEEGGSSQVAATNQQKGQRQQNQKQQGQERLMNYPPGKKPYWKHAEEWRNHKMQKSANGNCSFCDKPGRGAKSCYHLVVENPSFILEASPGTLVFEREEDPVS